MGMKVSNGRSKKKKLGYVARDIFEWLEQAEEGTSEDIAEAIEKSPSSVYQILNRMRHDKLVKRTDGHTGAGRNPAVFSLTTQGHAALKRDRKARAE